MAVRAAGAVSAGVRRRGPALPRVTEDGMGIVRAVREDLRGGGLDCLADPATEEFPGEHNFSGAVAVVAIAFILVVAVR